MKGQLCNKMTDKRKILFMCVENAGRSQMAEGFFKKYAPLGWTSSSAGSRPAHTINPIVIQAMKEVGIDINNQKPKELSSRLLENLNVNMGCMDKTECPTIFTGNFQDWNIEDPKNKSIEEVRVIRDKIEEKVKELVRYIESC